MNRWQRGWHLHTLSCRVFLGQRPRGHLDSTTSIGVCVARGRAAASTGDGTCADARRTTATDIRGPPSGAAAGGSASASRWCVRRHRPRVAQLPTPHSSAFPRPCAAATSLVGDYTPCASRTLRFWLPFRGPHLRGCCLARAPGEEGARVRAVSPEAVPTPPRPPLRGLPPMTYLGARDKTEGPLGVCGSQRATQRAHSPTSTVGTARAVPLAARARARGVLAPSPEAGPVGGGSSVWLAPSPRPRRRRALRDSPSMAVAQQNSSSHLAGAFGGTASREWRIFRCSIEAPSTVHFQQQHLSWATATGPSTALSTAPRAPCYYYQAYNGRGGAGRLCASPGGCASTTPLRQCPLQPPP